MGGEYEILVAQGVRDFLDGLDDKSTRIIKDNLGKLSQPHPGRGAGDKEKITWRGQRVYRLHIGRTWTAFYNIEEGDEVVRVLKVMPIDDAHQEYGDLG